MKKETNKKCEAIVRMMTDIINNNNYISLEPDLGKNTLTLLIEGNGHFHVGFVGGSFDDLVNNIYNVLHTLDLNKK